MAKISKTSFEKKCEILGELWLEYREDSDFDEFFYYNDLGVPLAYAINQKVIKSAPKAEEYIEEAFQMLLKGMGVEDTGFDSLKDIMEMDAE